MRLFLLITPLLLCCCQSSPCERKAAMAEALLSRNVYQRDLRYPNQDLFFGYPQAPIQDERLGRNAEELHRYLSVWLSCCKRERARSAASDEEIFNAEDEVLCLTPLMLACRLGDVAAVRFLLSRAIDINKQTTLPFCENNVARTAVVGQTALHYAALGGHRQAAELLLQHGADAAVTNSAGLTAAQLSCQQAGRGAAGAPSADARDPQTPSAVLREVLAQPLPYKATKEGVMYVRWAKEYPQPHTPIAIRGLVADYLCRLETSPTSPRRLQDTRRSPERSERSFLYAEIKINGHHYIWCGQDVLVSADTGQVYPFPFAQSALFRTPEIARPILFPCSLGEEDNPDLNNAAVAKGGRPFLRLLEQTYRQAMDNKIPRRFDCWHGRKINENL